MKLKKRTAKLSKIPSTKKTQARHRRILKSLGGAR